METRRFEVPPQSGGRADRVLVDLGVVESRAQGQRLIGEGLVTLGGKVIKASTQLSPGDEVTCTIPPPEPLEIEEESIPLDVLYEDPHLIVINKPRGMVVHPAPGSTSGTLVNALLHHCQDLSGVGGKIRPGIVHRLDKDTSGVLMVAKTDQAHHSLAAQIKERSVHRAYRAVVVGSIPQQQLTIDAPIGRHPKDRKRMAVVLDGRARHAITHVQVLGRFGRFTEVWARLETGRTHQIRVHLSYLGHPLLGDEVYGSGKNPWGLQGQALHAEELAFRHPITGERLSFSAPLPKVIEEILTELRG